MTDRERDHRNATIQALILGPLALIAFLTMVFWFLLPVYVLIFAPAPLP